MFIDFVAIVHKNDILLNKPILDSIQNIQCNILHLNPSSFTQMYHNECKVNGFVKKDICNKQCLDIGISSKSQSNHLGTNSNKEQCSPSSRKELNHVDNQLLINNIRQSGGFQGFGDAIKGLEEGICEHKDVRLPSFDWEKPIHEVRKKVKERMKQNRKKLQVYKGIGRNKDLVDAIFAVLIKKRFRRGPSKNHLVSQEDYLHRIQSQVDREEKIQLVLPSFPVKSYCPLKASRKMPDLGEVACLCQIFEIILEIEHIYPIGAECIIILDGLVYYKIFQEPEGIAEKYADKVREFVQNLGIEKYISVIDMTECIANFEEDFLREKDIARKIVWNKFHSGEDQEFWNDLIFNTASNINLTMYSLEVLRSIFFKEPCDTVSQSTLSQIKGDIFKRATAAALDYAIFLQAINKADIVMKNFPKCLRVTCHAKMGQICFHMIAKECTNNFPWNSVGMINENGRYRCIFEDLAKRDKKYYAVYIGSEKFPFYYQKIASNNGSLQKQS